MEDEHRRRKGRKCVTEFWVTPLIILISVDLVVRRVINRISDEFLATLVGAGVCDDLGPEQWRAQRLRSEVALPGRLLVRWRAHGDSSP